jgi:NAD(P)H-hydrate repair Nnr-like enzyme with NAD(P)H-hydrate dehydratase domain
VGLAISGSGEVLAGIIADLACRGASAAQAACWGVALHARAGEELATRNGPLGYLARDLSARVPAIMATLAAKTP